MQALDDQQLVELIRAGNDAAFNEILRRYQRPVVNFVYRLLGDTAEADDVAQEVFVRVYQHLDRYAPRGRFTTWLFALARNASIDRLRWRRRHPTEPLESSPALAAPAGAGAAEQASAREVGELVAAAVARLPEDQQTAFVLSEYHDWPVAEIAQLMRCSEKSVESRIYRAKQSLRPSLRFLMER